MIKPQTTVGFGTGRCRDRVSDKKWDTCDEDQGWTQDSALVNPEELSSRPLPPPLEPDLKRSKVVFRVDSRGSDFFLGSGSLW